MRCVARTFFKDSRGKWHQPGNNIDMTSEEAAKQEALGNITIRTAMVEPPDTRRTKKRTGRKR